MTEKELFIQVTPTTAPVVRTEEEWDDLNLAAQHPCDGCGAYADCDRCQHQKVTRPALPVRVDPCDDCGGGTYCDDCGNFRRA